jgi:hypothetical protein
VVIQPRVRLICAREKAITCFCVKLKRAYKVSNAQPEVSDTIGSLRAKPFSGRFSTDTLLPRSHEFDASCTPN